MVRPTRQAEAGAEPQALQKALQKAAEGNPAKLAARGSAGHAAASPMEPLGLEAALAEARAATRLATAAAAAEANAVLRVRTLREAARHRERTQPP